MDDGNIGGADEREDGCGLRGPIGIVDRIPQRDVAQIDEEQDQLRDQPRVAPLPIGAPHRLAPERTRQKGKRGKSGAQRRGRLRRYVGQGVAENQASERGASDQGIDENAHPGGGDVHEHDLDALALLVIGRGGEECPIEADGEQHEGQAPRPRQKRARIIEKTLGICENRNPGHRHSHRRDPSPNAEPLHKPSAGSCRNIAA